MPAPPPAGVSSTARCRPRPWSRMLRASSDQMAARQRIARQRGAERAGKHLGIERQDGRGGTTAHGSDVAASASSRSAHDLSSPAARRRRARPARSTTGTTALVNGSRSACRRPRRRISRMSPAPKFSTAATVPSRSPSARLGAQADRGRRGRIRPRRAAADRRARMESATLVERLGRRAVGDALDAGDQHVVLHGPQRGAGS